MRKITFLFLNFLLSLILLAGCGATGTAVNNNSSSAATNTSTSEGTGKFVLDVLGSLVGNYTSLKQADLIGTWNYTGTDVRFKSENLLKNAGGEVAAKEIESQLNDAFSKVGIKAGSCTFTFNSDNTYSAMVGNKKISGTYTLDEANKKITLTYLLGMATLEATVAKSFGNISLLFDADKILTFINLASSFSNSTSIKALGSLAGQYEGLLLGLQMKK